MKATTEKKITRTIAMPPSLSQRVQTAALRQHRSFSSLVSILIEKGLKEEEESSGSN